MDTQSKDQERVLELNKFYRDAYRNAMQWLVVMAVIAVFLTVILAWLFFQRRQPEYYAAMTTGEVVPMHALSEPVITNEFVTQWSALTVRMIYNLSFDNYKKQLDAAQDRFTPEGWEKLMGALKDSGLLDDLVNNRLIISAVVSGTPVVLTPFVLQGRYTWPVQMRLLVTYTSASTQAQRSVIVTMNVQRVPTLNTAQGIQVTNFSAKNLG